MRPLAKTKQIPFKKKVYGFDIETYNDNKDFLMASVYLDEKNYWFFYDKDSLIDFFKTKRFQNSFVAATNLSFDFFGTFYNKEDLQNFDTLFRGSELIYAKTNIKGKAFSRTRKSKKGKQGNPITFIDTLNYARMPVWKLGKIIGYEKFDTPSFIGDKPKDREEWQIMKDYNLRDSTISKKYIDFLFNSFSKLGATPKMTIASTAMSLYKNKYLKAPYWKHNIEDLRTEFKAYYGGRTEVFQRGIVKGYNYYDFNSLYPSVMINDYPDPNTLRKTTKGKEFYIDDYEGMSYVTINSPMALYPLLPLRHDDKLTFPSGEWTGWYSHIELRRAKDLGYTIKKIINTYYFTKMCSPFKEYVNDLYKKRLKYKSQCPSCKGEFSGMDFCPNCGVELGNSMQQVVKLLLNSLYGKFGQKFDNKDNWTPMNLTKEELDELDDFEVINGFIRTKKDMEPATFCFPIWALYTTSMARIKLHNAILKTNPVYCDTDSLITKKHLEDSNKLGELKLEEHIKEGIFVKPKCYGFINNRGEECVKIKGIPKKLSYDDFKHFLDKPKVTYMKFMKIKEATRRGFIPNEKFNMSKTMDLNDNKRLWEGTFNKDFLSDSKPLTLYPENIISKDNNTLISEMPSIVKRV